jgi:hypothetical protein
MKRSFNLILRGRYHPLLVCYRSVSKKNYDGIRERFDEKKARVYFDKWIKSLW